MNPEQQKQNQPTHSDIALKASQQRKPILDPTGKVENILPSETKIFDVRRHIFGLVLIYIQVFLGLALAFGLILPFLPEAAETLGINKSAASAVAGVISVLVIILAAFFLILATRIYRNHQLIVTDSNVTQVLQIGLFNRKVSELSMSNVEDVTAHQKGIFQTVFNYGVLKVETAGEQNNFVFHYCPNPNATAKALLDTRSQYLQHNPHDNV